MSINTTKRSVTQSWTHELSFMQQSVLLTAIRGPDGLHKNHVSKQLLRWFRRCTLLMAFDGTEIDRPFNLPSNIEEGGSFTGPSVPYDPHIIYWETQMDEVVDKYLSTVDEIPHHFQLHLMHAAEIVGYKHPNQRIRKWWFRFYLRLVNDMHLNPESLQQMNKRLGDNQGDWRAAEEVIAD